MTHARTLCALLVLLVLLLGGCSAIGQAGPTPVPTAIVFDQATDSFSVEVDMVKGVKHPIYPGALPIYTLVDGERKEGLIPPSPNKVKYGRVNGGYAWIPLISIVYKQGEWVVGRAGMWSPRAMRLGPDEPAYTPGEPVQVWIRKQPTKGSDVPAYWFTVEGTAMPID